MKIIVGLGNPGENYTHTRHNIGFDVLDDFAAKKSASFSAKDKFRAHVAELSLHGEKILLVKPQTFYNDSGESVRAVADFYKVEPGDVLVVHDDHALPLGIVRTRIGSSDAGNNGVKSINAHMPGTSRVRVGTHAEHRAAAGDTDFVLSRFNAAEKRTLEKTLPIVYEILEKFAQSHFTETTYRATLDAE